MKEFHPARQRIKVSVGESVRIVRELQELSQSQLSELSGIPQATIQRLKTAGAIWVSSGTRCARGFDAILRCWCFPGWEIPTAHAA